MGSDAYALVAQGPQGPPGPPGGSVLSSDWIYDSASTISDPGAGKLKTDGPPVTTVCISHIDSLGIDRSAEFGASVVGNQVLIRDLNGNELKGTSSASVNQGAWHQVTLINVVTTGTAPNKNAQVEVSVLMTPPQGPAGPTGPQGPQGPAGGTIPAAGADTTAAHRANWPAALESGSLNLAQHLQVGGVVAFGGTPANGAVTLGVRVAAASPYWGLYLESGNNQPVGYFLVCQNIVNGSPVVVWTIDGNGNIQLKGSNQTYGRTVPVVQSGQATITINSGTALGNVVVTYPFAFATNPAIAVTLSGDVGQMVTLAASTVSSGAFTLYARVAANVGSNLTFTVWWTATGQPN